MTRAEGVIEFYRQLGLLLKAQMPLPESLQSLARQAGNRQLQTALAQVAADTANGIPFAEALRPHRILVTPFQVRLIAASEKSGTLPDVLFEVAGLARFEQNLEEQVRNIALYPLFTISFALGLFLVLLKTVIFGLSRLVQDSFLSFLNDFNLSHFPTLTVVVFTLSGWVERFWLPITLIFLLLVACGIWLLLPFPTSRASLRRVIRFLPGCSAILRQLDLARVCGTWAVLIRHQVPFDQALELTAGMTSDPTLAAALQRLAKQTAAGVKLVACLDNEAAIPDTIRITLQHTPEADLPRELDGLRDFFREQAENALRKTAVYWEFTAVAIMSLTVLLVILGMYGPIIQMLRIMSGASGGCPHAG